MFGSLVGALTARQTVTAVVLILVGVLVVAAFWIFAALIRAVFARALEREHLPPEVVLLSSRVVFFGLLIVGVFVGLGVALQASNVALAGVIAATVVASLGVQDILRSYVSGFYILLERNIRVGNEIEFNGKLGTVTDVRMRVTYLRAENGDLVIVPNAELFNSTVVSRPGRATETPARAPGDRLASALRRRPRK
jgi:small-conductance mechanosensitive channel